MRREGYIIEEIIEYSNMSEAFDSVLRGTDRKRSRQGRFLLAHREKIITELTASIAVFHGQDLQNTFFTVFFNFPLMVAAQPE